MHNRGRCVIRKQKGRTVISICPVLQSDLSLLNEGLWVHGERHVSLQAASTQDKDAECACIPHRSLRQSSGGSVPRAACEQSTAAHHGCSRGILGPSRSTTELSDTALFIWIRRKFTQAFTYSNRRARRLVINCCLKPISICNC